MATDEQEGSVQKVGEIIKPIVPDGFVQDLLDKVYGLKVLSVKQFKSYDDCNYALTIDPVYDNEHIRELWSHGYLLKIINSMDSKRPIMHEAHNACMDHLRSKGVPTQRSVPDKQGRVMSHQQIYANMDKTGTCNEHIVRLLTFLPGNELLDFPFTPNVLYEDGKFIAQVTRGMQGFQNDFLQKFDSKWNLGNIPLLKDYVFVLKPKDKEVVDEIIAAFENEIDLEKLPKGCIHGDLNEMNILVLPESGQEQVQDDKKRYRFTGVIDFQDTTFSCTIYDLAINIAYLSIFTETIDKLDVPGHVLAGYLSLHKLTETEMDALKVLIAARLCQSLVYGAHTYFLDPTDDYVLHTAKRGWSVLHRFWSEPKEKLHNRWTTTIEQYST